MNNEVSKFLAWLDIICFIAGASLAILGNMGCMFFAAIIAINSWIVIEVDKLSLKSKKDKGGE